MQQLFMVAKILAEECLTVSAHYHFSVRTKRQESVYGYGPGNGYGIVRYFSGPGGVFYGTIGGGFNNNYTDINIGRMNEVNIIG
ncbi:hypothetical protein Tcan_02014 [Toxocara canis]|uniref:Uncharacterized protein n=1 Tax=Toxocara canis TaxID=6265 RepID=A0A0B2UXG6_TOXCA|nr:hypothetical protein Tcan_02014 [Toxocara canis]